MIPTRADGFNGNGHGGLRGEPYAASRVRWQLQDEMGRALASARFEQGQRLTDEERRAIQHNARWGSDSYPVRRVGKRWTLEHPALGRMPIYRTLREAVAAWETLVACWIYLLATEQQ